MRSLEYLVELSGGVHASLQLSPRQRDKTPVGMVLEPRTSLLVLMPMQIARWAWMEVLLCACQCGDRHAYRPHFLFCHVRCHSLHHHVPSTCSCRVGPCLFFTRRSPRHSRLNHVRHVVHASIDSGFFVRLASPIERCAHIKSRPGISRADTCRDRASPSSTPDTPQ